MSTNQRGTSTTNSQSSSGSQPAGGSELISQAEIARFDELNRVLSERKALRGSRVSRLERGTPIEPGPLTISINLVPNHRITAAKLEALFGPTGLAQIQAQIQARIPRRCTAILSSATI